MSSTLKVEFYDDFNCIADQCSFTCCKGWDINVNKETYSRWIGDENLPKHLSDHVKVKKSGKESKYFIKMGPQKCCPFLDEKGLCNIVLQYKEENLPHTCKVFPRQENNYGEQIEYSLSCACPSVVDLLDKVEGNINLLQEGEVSAQDGLPMKYYARDTMISIMQASRIAIKDRLLLIFQMMLMLKKGEKISEEVLSHYKEEEYLRSLVEIWSGHGINTEDSIGEINELFLDVVENYKKEIIYSPYLKEIARSAEELDIESSLIQWDNFIAEFGKYDILMENCLVLKIFSNCINDDINDMIMSFQMIVTEYIMIKYSVFLNDLLRDGECNTIESDRDIKRNQNNNGTRSRCTVDQQRAIEYTNIRDYIVVFSRIIGHNVEGFREFWEESFDEAVWDFGYMLLLLA